MASSAIALTCRKPAALLGGLGKDNADDVSVVGGHAQMAFESPFDGALEDLSKAESPGCELRLPKPRHLLNGGASNPPEFSSRAG